MKNNLHHIGQIVALISFVIGTCFLSLFLYFGTELIDIRLAILYILIATIVNSVIFVTLLGIAILNKPNRAENLKTSFVMLLNVPVAVLYIYMIVTFPHQNLLL